MTTQQLSRSLKNRHITMISIGGIIGAGLFVGSSAAIAAAGPGIILSYLFTGVLILLVMRMLGARRATPDQARRLEPAWRSVAQQLGIRPRRYALAVLPSDELNLVISSFVTV